VIRGDPNVELVELVAAALGDLREELVLVGGCAASLLIEAPTAMPPRATWDVDLIATVAALKEYHALEARFAARGFARDVSRDAPVCRWTLGAVKVAAASFATDSTATLVPDDHQPSEEPPCFTDSCRSPLCFV
jgi:predicted nucleotidyltransferase